MLEAIAPELLFILLHEQLSLYNAPPPLATAPLAPAPAPSARQERVFRLRLLTVTPYGDALLRPTVTSHGHGQRPRLTVTSSNGHVLRHALKHPTKRRFRFGRSAPRGPATAASRRRRRRR